MNPNLCIEICKIRKLRLDNIIEIANIDSNQHQMLFYLYSIFQYIPVRKETIGILGKLLLNLNEVYFGKAIHFIFTSY